MKRVYSGSELLCYTGEMRNMRRKDRELPREEALDIVDNCAYAVMATVNPDGTPYCIPLSLVWEGELLYFHSALEGHKIDNLKVRNRVCICCVGAIKPIPGVFSIGYESAVISGPAFQVTDREEMIHALTLISKRYTPANMAAFDKAIEKQLGSTGVWKIRIEEISGKANRPK